MEVYLVIFMEHDGAAGQSVRGVHDSLEGAQYQADVLNQGIKPAYLGDYHAVEAWYVKRLEDSPLHHE